MTDKTDKKSSNPESQAGQKISAFLADRIEALQALGWNEHFTQAAHEAAGEFGVGVLMGRVIRVDKGAYWVKTPDADVGEVLCISKKAPAVGDWIFLEEASEGDFVMRKILKRKGILGRRNPAAESSRQVLAANVDAVALVYSLEKSSNPARIERGLVLAAESGAEACIVFTKADLATKEEVSAAKNEVSGLFPGEPIITSTETGLGLDQLKEFIDGRTMIFFGASGVGKTSLTNALEPGENRSISEVRQGDMKGRHTTTARDLVYLKGGGAIIDTPGLRALGMLADSESIDEVFSDIANLAQNCRFRDCQHENEPDCAVLAELGQKQLSAERFDRYKKLKTESADTGKKVEEKRRIQRR